MHFGRGELIRIALLVMAGVVIALGAWGRLDPATWATPVSYQGDGLQIMTWIRAAQEGQYFPVLPIAVERLGAPFFANWNDYPMYEKPLTTLFGLVARIFGLFAAANFAVLFAHVTSAVSFYLCCRFLRFRWEWSFAGALLFAFTYYAMWRGLPHVLLAYSYTIPPALLTCWIFASERLLKRRRVRLFCGGVMIVMGASNPYNLLLFLQLFGLTVAVRYAVRRDSQLLFRAGKAVALAVISFAIVNAGTFIHAAREGRNPNVIDRKYFECEQFALKPLELLIPPPAHNVPGLAAIGRHYDGLFKLPGETFSAYLGVVGIAALLALLVEVLRRSLQRRPRRNTSHLWLIGWVFAYSMVGGLNNLAALGGFTILRATNRFSIFISALLLFYLVSRASLLGRSRSRAWSIGLAALVLTVGLVDQVPLRPAREKIARIQEELAVDRDFFGRMEQLLPPGAMVFELPVMEFPESGPILNLNDYEPVRGYLHTRQLRYSYGSNKGRPRDDWQQIVADLPPKQMIAELEDMGFGAILIHRAAFADRATSLARFLGEAGRDQIIFDRVDGDRVCVRLHPSSSPRLPHPDDYVPVRFRDGWARWDLTATHSRRWTTDTGKVEFVSRNGGGGKHRLTAELQALADLEVRLLHDGAVAWQTNMTGGQPVNMDIVLAARPGTNRMQIHIAGAFEPGQNALAVANSRLRLHAR